MIVVEYNSKVIKRIFVYHLLIGVLRSNSQMVESFKEKKKEIYQIAENTALLQSETSLGLDFLQQNARPKTFTMNSGIERARTAKFTGSGLSYIGWPTLSTKVNSTSKKSLIGLEDAEMDLMISRKRLTSAKEEPKGMIRPSSEIFRITHQPARSQQLQPNVANQLATHHLSNGFGRLSSAKKPSTDSRNDRTRTLLEAKVHEYTIRVQSRQGKRSSGAIYQQVPFKSSSNMALSPKTGRGSSPPGQTNPPVYGGTVYEPTQLDLPAAASEPGSNLLTTFCKLFGEGLVHTLYEEFGAGSLEGVLRKKGIEIPKAKKNTALRARYDMNAGFVASDKPPAGTANKRRNSKTLSSLLL